MNLRTASLLAVLPLLGLALSPTVRAQDMDDGGLPGGYGVAIPSGSKFTTFLSYGDDVDDFVFAGYPGQKLTAKLKVSKKSDVNGGLKLIRPDGSAVDEADGAKVKRLPAITVVVDQVVTDPGPPPVDVITQVNIQVQPVETISFVLDQVGTWKVRVDVLDDFVAPGDTGEYSLSAKYNKAPKIKDKGAQPDENGQLIFDVPAAGGATLDFVLNFKGANVEFNGLFDPRGTLIDSQFNSSGEQSDLIDRIATRPGRNIKGKKITLPAGDIVGNYRVVFDVVGGIGLTKSKFVAKTKFPKGASRRRGKLDANEPVLGSEINPSEGGPGTSVTVKVVNAIDKFDPNGDPVLMIGGVPLDDITVSDGPGHKLVTGKVPAVFPEGAYTVVVQTSTGQQDVAENAFERVPPPQVFDIDPRVGPDTGGVEVTITGANFVPGQMGVILEGSLLPLLPSSVTENQLVFTIPSRAPGFYTFGVIDTFTQLRANTQVGSFQYLSSPGISRVVPRLMSVLGGDTIFVKGTFFEAADEIWMENASGGFDEITATQTTFVNDKLHAFIAPVRPKGTYEIYMVDDQAVRTTGTHTIDYFTFADFTVDLGLGSGATSGNLRDAWTTALGDFDNDGDDDLFLARQGGASKSGTSLLQLFQNDGTGTFTDVSTTAIPSTSTTDDWRADRIRVADANQDGYVDIFLATASAVVPGSSASHVRILINERRSSQTPVTDRVFRDQTATLMAPPRGSQGGNDNWAALDMWVGDIDRGPTGPPEILITGRTQFEEIDVTCGNYCSSNVGGALYRFYWGGSREFAWDTTKRSGQGQYKFDPNFFPRKSGVLVPIGNPPPGATIPACNTGTPCRGKFTPFTGHSIVVGELNSDGKPDIVVLNDQPVQRDGETISSTQVAINGFNPAEGSAITDVTHLITELGSVTNTRFDTALINSFGYPDGNGYGTIVLARAATTTDPAMRLIRFVPPLAEGEIARFEDITSLVLPTTGANDKFQASALGSADVDADGDQDLVLVASQPPGPGESAFRILRNDVVNFTGGILREGFAGLIDPIVTATGDAFDGTSLLLGDLDKDGALEFIVTRSVVVGSGTQTRAITVDK